MRQRLKPVWTSRLVHTIDSRHGLPVAPNVLARQFHSTASNVAHAPNMTCIRTGAGWLHLAVMLDLFSRKVVGWAMAPSMPTSLGYDALRMVNQQCQPLQGLIVPSARGRQYASY